MEEDEDVDSAAAAATEQRVAAVRRAFPSVGMLHITASSTRDYPASYTQVQYFWLCGNRVPKSLGAKQGSSSSSICSICRLRQQLTAEIQAVGSS
jgi:hypothetical protein